MDELDIVGHKSVVHIEDAVTFIAGKFADDVACLCDESLEASKFSGSGEIVMVCSGRVTGEQIVVPAEALPDGLSHKRRKGVRETEYRVQYVRARSMIFDFARLDIPVGNIVPDDVIYRFASLYRIGSRRS